MMAPFRFTAQWALFPLLAAGAVVLGAGLGGLDAWLSTHPSADDAWLQQVIFSPLPLILVITLLGVATNSWTIATLTGLLTSISAYLAQEIGESRWAEAYSTEPNRVVIGSALALLAGGALGLAACTWHHENGPTRALGAGVLGGALLWAGWQDLAPADWERSTDFVVAWASISLAVICVLRCGRPGLISTAAIAAVAIAWVVQAMDWSEPFDLREMVDIGLNGVNDLIDRIRSALRS